jgi:hypothetical protein
VDLGSRLDLPEHAAIIEGLVINRNKGLLLLVVQLDSLEVGAEQALLRRQNEAEVAAQRLEVDLPNLVELVAAGVGAPLHDAVAQVGLVKRLVVAQVLGEVRHGGGENKDRCGANEENPGDLPHYGAPVNYLHININCFYEQSTCTIWSRYLLCLRFHAQLHDSELKGLVINRRIRRAHDIDYFAALYFESDVFKGRIFLLRYTDRITKKPPIMYI